MQRQFSISPNIETEMIKFICIVALSALASGQMVRPGPSNPNWPGHNQRQQHQNNPNWPGNQINNPNWVQQPIAQPRPPVWNPVPLPEVPVNQPRPNVNPQPAPPHMNPNWPGNRQNDNHRPPIINWNPNVPPPQRPIAPPQQQQPPTWQRPISPPQHQQPGWPMPPQEPQQPPQWQQPGWPQIPQQPENGVRDSRCPPNNGRHPIMFPHERQCNLYYMCNNGLRGKIVQLDV